MSNPSPNDPPSSLPWGLNWPAWTGLAPQQLNQPINPGWNFGNVTINNVNSTAPQVEQDVLARHSYGRQIGRLMDAVEALVRAVPSVKAEEEVLDFLQLVKDIKTIKKTGTEARLARLRLELAALKERDHAAWEDLVGRR